MSSSTPSAAGPSPEDDRSSNVGKYVKRIKTALRRGSVRNSISSLSALQSDSKNEEPKPAATSSSTSKPQPEARSVPVTSVTGTGSFARSAVQQEKARALFAKYGLTLEAHEWLTTGVTNTNVQRVEKPIRMRVVRSCHRCQVTFGVDRTCVNCQHRRCQKCPRYPKKKTKDGEEKKKKSEEPKPMPLGRASRAKADAPQLTLTTRDGKERTRTAVHQRIRRTCHHCNQLFIPSTRTECEGCQHVRCVKCPREPAKTHKYPNGYPGDAQASDAEEPVTTVADRPERAWRKPRQRVRWMCESCETLFREGSKSCTGCGHVRGSDGCACTREPPKKTQKPVDPEVLKSVEAKMAAMQVSDQPAVPAAA